MSVSAVPDSSGSLAELIERLGFVPPERIRLVPPPGTATERDVLARPDGVKRLCELVDGVLVEKAIGYYESRLAVVLIGFLHDFLKQHNIGIVLGADATLRLISERNTEAERKLREYFSAGVRLVWYVEPDARTVRVYTSIDQSTLLTVDRTLDGGTVLPGFTLVIRQWFDEAGQRRAR